jgi:hypothetical protein
MPKQHIQRQKYAKLIILIALALLLFSCAHGKTEDFREPADPSDAAEVYVFRDNTLFGWGFSLKVSLDNEVVAALRRGEYVSFFVEPGFHSLGITKSTITVPFQKGKAYYFLISPDYSQFGFDIERLDDSKAEYWLTNTKRIN